MKLCFPKNYEQHEMIPEFFNVEFVTVIKELEKIVTKCDESAVNPEDRLIQDFELIVEHIYDDRFIVSCCFDLYGQETAIQISDDLPCDVNRHMKRLTDITANMFDIIDHDKDHNLTGRDYVIMLILNFSHYLKTNPRLWESGNFYTLQYNAAEVTGKRIPAYLAESFNFYGVKEKDETILDKMNLADRFSEFRDFDV
jgi:hypothetical protein